MKSKKKLSKQKKIAITKIKIKSNRKKNGVGNHKKINTKNYLIFYK
jgi:hypothetical protein